MQRSSGEETAIRERCLNQSQGENYIPRHQLHRQ
jgi:hypothetical protein